jgi:hypothetical protein
MKFSFGDILFLVCVTCEINFASLHSVTSSNEVAGVYTTEHCSDVNSPVNFSIFLQCMKKLRSEPTAPRVCGCMHDGRFVLRNPAAKNNRSAGVEESGTQSGRPMAFLTIAAQSWPTRLDFHQSNGLVVCLHPNSMDLFLNWFFDVHRTGVPKLAAG